MSKELTPLEAFYDLIDVYFDNEVVKEKYGITKQTFIEKKKIIETALKEYELMKRTKLIVADKKISDDDLEKLKNQRMFVSNLEQCEIKPLFDEETQNKLKALEIIKERRVDVRILTSYIKECPDDEWALAKYNSLCEERMQCKIYEGRDYFKSLPLTKEKFDLLKEELK